jgi:hypothetical protein
MTNYSGIVSDISSESMFGIYILTVYLTFYLAVSLALYLASILALFLASVLTYYLTFFLAYVLAFYPAFYLILFLAFSLVFSLAFYLASILTSWFGILSGLCSDPCVYRQRCERVLGPFCGGEKQFFGEVSSKPSLICAGNIVI